MMKTWQVKFSIIFFINLHPIFFPPSPQVIMNSIEFKFNFNQLNWIQIHFQMDFLNFIQYAF
jgi:hypothetical protein